MPRTRNISPILQAYIQGRQEREAREARQFSEARALEAEKLNTEKFAEYKKQFEAQLKFDQEKFKADQALRQADSNRRQLQLKADFLRLGSSGVPMEFMGATPTPVDNTTPQFNENLRQGNFGQLFNQAFPMGDGTFMQVPSAEQIADYQKTLAEPANKAAMERERQKILAQAGLEDIRQTGRKEITEMQTERTINKANIDAAAKIRAAEIMAAARMQGASVDPSVLTPYVQGIINGTYSHQDFAALGLKPEERKAVLSAAAQQDFVPVTAKQKASLVDLTSAGGLLDKMKQFVDVLQPSENKYMAQVTGLAKKLDPEITAQEQEITGQVGNIAKVIGGESGRLTEQDIERAKGLVPGRRLSKKENERRIKEFEKLINERAKKLLVGISDEQRDSIFANYNIPVLKSDKGNAWVVVEE